MSKTIDGDVTAPLAQRADLGITPAAIYGGSRDGSMRSGCRSHFRETALGRPGDGRPAARSALPSTRCYCSAKRTTVRCRAHAVATGSGILLYRRRCLYERGSGGTVSLLIFIGNSCGCVGFPQRLLCADCSVSDWREEPVETGVLEAVADRAEVQVGAVHTVLGPVVVARTKGHAAACGQFSLAGDGEVPVARA